MPQQDELLKVYADRRWPLLSGIGTLQHELEVRCPSDLQLIDLEVPGSIGSPMSPVNVMRAFQRKAKGRNVMFYSAGFIPPLWTSKPTVLFVHDLMHRQFYGWAKRAYYDWFLRYLYRRCWAICCVSEYSRTEFLEWSGVDPKRVHVVNSMCSADFSTEGAKYEPGYAYIAYAGNHRNYKNLNRLIRAYGQSQLPGKGIRLLITGKRNEALAAVAQEVGCVDSVVFSGFLPAEDIPKLYRGAVAIAYVSLQEGFGLPILEAYSSGVPIVTSNVTSMPEVAGDAAILVNPYSIEAIRHGLDRVVTDEELRRTLIERGFRRVQDFGWDKSAAKLWGLVRQVSK